VDIPLSFADTIVTDLTGPWEEFSVLVETDSHDSIGRIEGFFDTITVVDVDVDVEHSGVISGH
jgi:hypothetical protein